MTTRPLIVERLLEGLSPATPFRDAIIGDLAEEFRQRAESDGPGSARAWYYREAVRLVPHLLSASLRSFRGGDLPQLANVLLMSLVLSALTLFFALLTGTSVMSALGYTAKTTADGPVGLVMTAIGLVAVGVSSIVGGAVAASLDRRTPFATAVMSGIFYLTANVSLSLLAPRVILPPRAINEVVIVVGAIIGGVLRARATPMSGREPPVA